MGRALLRKRLSDIPPYPFYLACQALAKLRAAAGNRPATPLWLRRCDYWQLKLKLKLQPSAQEMRDGQSSADPLTGGPFRVILYGQVLSSPKGRVHVAS
jgi:hypothetical protein